MGSLLMRVKATIGAPERSGPYSGKAWKCRPRSTASSATILAAVTAPWPPRACHRISVSLALKSMLLTRTSLCCGGFFVAPARVCPSGRTHVFPGMTKRVPYVAPESIQGDAVACYPPPTVCPSSPTAQNGSLTRAGWGQQGRPHPRLDRLGRRLDSAGPHRSVEVGHHQRRPHDGEHDSHYEQDQAEYGQEAGDHGHDHREDVVGCVRLDEGDDLAKVEEGSEVVGGGEADKCRRQDDEDDQAPQALEQRAAGAESADYHPRDLIDEAAGPDHETGDQELSPIGPLGQCVHTGGDLPQGADHVAGHEGPSDDGHEHQQSSDEDPSA